MRQFALTYTFVFILLDFAFDEVYEKEFDSSSKIQSPISSSKVYEIVICFQISEYLAVT